MLKQWLKNLESNVKARRKTLGLSQQALAEKAQVSLNTITRIEQGAAENIRLATIEAIGKGLKESDPLKLLKK